MIIDCLGFRLRNQDIGLMLAPDSKHSEQKKRVFPKWNESLYMPEIGLLTVSCLLWESKF